MKGGTIVAKVDGTLRGNNSTGRADAAFLNVLKIKWTGGKRTTKFDRIVFFAR